MYEQIDGFGSPHGVDHKCAFATVSPLVFAFYVVGLEIHAIVAARHHDKYEEIGCGADYGQDGEYDGELVHFVRVKTAVVGRDEGFLDEFVEHFLLVYRERLHGGVR